MGRLLYLLPSIPMKALPIIAVNGVPFFVDARLSELRKTDDPHQVVAIPRLKMQEIPYNAEASTYRFEPSSVKAFVVTTAAETEYGQQVICGCLSVLQHLADEHNGLDYLQVFDDASGTKSEPLWFIEDGDGGAITALLPSDY
jgi:hypothetical protein